MSVLIALQINDKELRVVSILEVLALLTLLISVYKLGKDDNKKDRH